MILNFAPLFGSFARGEADENSDIDLLVRFLNQKELIGLMRRWKLKTHWEKR